MNKQIKPKTQIKKTKSKTHQSNGKQHAPPRAKRRKTKPKDAQASLLSLVIALGILFVLVCIWHLKR